MVFLLHLIVLPTPSPHPPRLVAHFLASLSSGAEALLWVVAGRPSLAEPAGCWRAYRRRPCARATSPAPASPVPASPAAPASEAASSPGTRWRAPPRHLRRLLSGFLGLHPGHLWRACPTHRPKAGLLLLPAEPRIRLPVPLRAS